MSFGWILLIDYLIGLVTLFILTKVVFVVIKHKYGDDILEETMKTDSTPEEDMRNVMILTTIASIFWFICWPIIFVSIFDEAKELHKFRKGS